MPIVHCEGHEFRPMTFAMDRDDKPGHSICKKCGLKVKTDKARDYLRGKRA